MRALMINSGCLAISPSPFVFRFRLLDVACSSCSCRSEDVRPVWMKPRRGNGQGNKKRGIYGLEFADETMHNNRARETGKSTSPRVRPCPRFGRAAVALMNFWREASGRCNPELLSSCFISLFGVALNRRPLSFRAVFVTRNLLATSTVCCANRRHTFCSPHRDEHVNDKQICWAVDIRHMATTTTTHATSHEPGEHRDQLRCRSSK